MSVPSTKLATLEALARTPFRPAFWARGGVAQTLAGMATRAKQPPWRTEVVPTPDGDAVHVHHLEAARADAPRVLVLHGLEGDRHSPYVRQTAALAQQQGFACACFEFRSCGGVLNRAERTYHSGETGDLAHVVAHLVAPAPMRPLLLLGVSLGANVLLKWLGEVGADAPAAVRAAVAISPPFDLGACAAQCDRGTAWIARHFLRSLIPKAIAKARQYPGRYDLAAVRRCRTFRAFDSLVTAPVHGFRDVDHYYGSQSCGPFLPRIARPTLLVAAADDPLLPRGRLPHAVVAASPWLHAEFPASGGHVAFVEGGLPWRPRRWAEAQALRFFALQLGASG